LLPFQNYTQDVKMNSQAKQSGKNQKVATERNLSETQNADLGKVTSFGQVTDNSDENQDDEGDGSGES
jgi:hypothetical protein